ncbi:type II toxin-antitoxin system prevent-host-death family antitoxin [Streptomyces triticiradicis]|uniref:Antitoxin n=1 Tax=Streptomyces triticiradicis TaxID=2651189 RepID=A0A7J5D542_9ACTN|nr:type II toxin-antitoxin system prevent-host-death family antitoxin [Streptomyces triticiradicis]KAB1979257.1 type II toxin-antitoxin system Phd/YefM family antitoxin [Streptomyces triticiradicis]
MSESGSRELGVSEARANMTEVIAEARLLDVDFVLTRRDKPQAVLISVKRYEQAKRDRELVDYIQTNWPDIYTDMTRNLKDHRA